MTSTETTGTYDVAVIGGGIAGLTVAFDCARAGLSVVVIEADARPGGLIRRETIGGLDLDAGAESFAVRGGAVHELVADLGLADREVEPLATGAYLLLPSRSSRTRAARIPRGSVLGIPARPFAADVRAAIGLAGALRAALDLVLPRRVGLAESTVAGVVRARMGRRVLERLVTPVVTGIHTTRPQNLELDSVAPGLRADARRLGSLQRAVRARATGTRAGSAVLGLAGGLFTLPAALAADVRDHGGTILVDSRATGIRSADAHADAAADGGGALEVDVESADGSARTVLARDVVIATPAREAVELVASLSGSQERLFPGATESVELVTLLLDAPALDARPRGTGVIVAPGVPGVGAKALTHSTAKWPWLRELVGEPRHVVRLSYPYRPEAARETPVEVERRAVCDAAVLLGVDEGGLRVVASGRRNWRDAVTPASSEHRAWLARWSESIAGLDHVRVTGAWLAGTGLASVVPHARTIARALTGSAHDTTMNHRKDSSNEHD